MHQFLPYLADASGIIANSTKEACKDACNTALTVPQLIANITNILVFLVGAISVVMIIVGGFRYVVSQGDSAATKQAKNTIMFAVIGVVVALVSYAVVNFVVNSVTSSSSGNSKTTADGTRLKNNKPLVNP